VDFAIYLEPKTNKKLNPSQKYYSRRNHKNNRSQSKISSKRHQDIENENDIRNYQV